MKYSVIGVNAGLGVSLYPFKDNLVANIETRRIFHTQGNEQWKLNFGDIPLHKEVKEPRLMPKYKVDILISSPDCGSGSILRYSRAKKLGDHTRNNSLLEFILVTKIYRPKIFYFENLSSLFKSFPKERFMNNLEEYHLVEHIAPVTHWGNSQVNRQRLVIIGIRRDLKYKKIARYFKLPPNQEPKTCSELYGDLERSPITGNVREPSEDVISIYGGKKLSLEQIRIQWQYRLDGKKRYYVPEEEGRKFKTAPGVYRNLDDDFPATARKANRQFDHNGLTLTPRQLARVQGVPDEFKLYIDKKNLKYWINKARTTVTKTPPYEISVWFKTQLEKSKKLWHKGKPTTN